MTIARKIRFLEFLLLLLASQYPRTGTAQPALRFIENKNQWSGDVDFMAQVPGGNLFIESGVWWFSLVDERKLEERHELGWKKFRESNAPGGLTECIDGEAIRLSFIGANRFAKPYPFGMVTTTYNYFIGNNSEKWGSNARAYEGIVYKSFYDGIDLKIHSEGKNVKYDFILAPGADPGLIVSEYEGTRPLNLSAGGVDILGSLLSLREMEPVAYQVIDGIRKTVPCQYVLNGNRIAYNLRGYDPCYELVIDPLLIFSTYSGSTADNWGSTATPGENGCLYSSGTTTKVFFGGFFPASPGAFQTSYGGLYDVAILKYDSSGHNLLYASYLGGSDVESPHSLVMNAQQELLVLGTTGSVNFPTTQTAYDRSFNGGTFARNVFDYSNGSDIFVARISKDGSQLLASTFIGGSDNDGLNRTGSPLVRNYGDELRGDIISDQLGDIFISTVTASSDFPAVNSFKTSYNGGVTDAVLMKLNNTLSQLTWSALLGGSNADASHTIKLDHLGNLFVAGGTESPDFPTTAGSYQTANAGGVDGWIANISGDGSSILSATFTGTSNFNQVYILDLNQQEEVYVFGQTVGSFPVTSGVFSNPNSGQFIQKFDNRLSTLMVSTVFGSGRGIPDISPTAFLVNDCNNLYVTGWGGAVNNLLGFWNSDTNGLPVTADAFQKTTSGSDFFLMVLTEDAKQLLYGTYMGGSDSRTHVDGGTSRFDKKGIVYHAVCSGCDFDNTLGKSSSDFPTTLGAHSRVNGSSNCNNAAFKFDLSSLRALIQTNTVQLNSPGIHQVCIPDKIVFQNFSTGGQVFNWDLGDGTQFAKQDTAYITHQYLNQGIYTIKLKAIDESTCVGKDSTFTMVQVFLPQGTFGDNQVICSGATAQLTASGGVTYAWESLDGTFVSALPQPSVSPADTTLYFITVTDNNGCKKMDSIKVSVVPGIDLKFSTSKIYNCFGRPSVQVKNLTDPKEDVFFDFGDGTTSDLPDDTHQFQKDGTYPVRIVGRKDFCVYDQQVDVPVYELKVPNVMTPDSSPGQNDAFVILYGGKPISESTQRASVSIYNRWGGKVMSSEDYKDNWMASNVPAGVYYYEVNIAGEINCKGWLQVIKN